MRGFRSTDEARRRAYAKRTERKHRAQRMRTREAKPTMRESKAKQCALDTRDAISVDGSELHGVELVLFAANAHARGSPLELIPVQVPLQRLHTRQLDRDHARNRSPLP